jgi:hypothetical protein
MLSAVAAADNIKFSNKTEGRFYAYTGFTADVLAIF